MRTVLTKFKYRYMEYEKQLQIREIEAVIPDVHVIEDDNKCTVIEAPILSINRLILSKTHIPDCNAFRSSFHLYS